MNQKIFIYVSFFCFTVAHGQLATYLLFPLQNYLPKLPPVHQFLPIPTTVIPKEETNSVVDDIQHGSKSLPFMKFINSPRFVTDTPIDESFFDDLTTSTKPSPTKSRTTFSTVSTTKATESVTERVTEDRFIELTDIKDESVKVPAEHIREGVFKNRTEIVLPENVHEELSVPTFVSPSGQKGSETFNVAHQPVPNFVERPFVLPEDNAARQQIQEAIKNGELGARNYLKTIPRIRYSDSASDILANDQS